MRSPMQGIASVVALGILSIAEPLAAQDGIGTPPPSFADTVSVGEEWAVLDSVFALAALGSPRAARYALTRSNLAVDRRGAVLSREITSVAFRRLPLDDAGKARFVWESFTAQRIAGGASEKRNIPLPRGASFDLDPAAFDLSLIAATPAPETSATEFRVLLIDAVMWDNLRMQIWRDSEVEVGRQISMDLPTDEQPVPGGTYQFGRGSLRIAGVTRVRGEPCLLVNFALEGSRMSIETEAIAFEGEEFFRGDLALSLRDGRVVSGHLWGPVIATFRQGEQELPLGGVVQYVTLTELPAGSRAREKR